MPTRSSICTQCLILVIAGWLAGCQPTENPQEGAPTECSGDTDCSSDVTPLPEALPTDMGGRLTYLFRNFDHAAARDAAMAALAEEAGGYDVSSPVDPGGLPTLSAGDLGAVSPPGGVDPADQIRTVLLLGSGQPLTQHITAALDPNQVCLQADTTSYYQRTFLTDTACFEVGACAELSTSAEAEYQSIVTRLWHDPYVDLARSELRDGRSAMAARIWNDAVALGTNGSEFRQGFGIDLWVEDPDDAGSTIWLAARWTEWLMPAVSDDLMEQLIRDGIEERVSSVDDVIDGVNCSNDRDRPYDRP